MDIRTIAIPKAGRSIPQVHVGDEVRVHAKVVEGDRERVQVFTGVIIKLHRNGVNSTMTVRRVSYGVGVERTFHLHSPRLEKVELVKHGKVARAKLYYIRERLGKSGRLKERLRPRGVGELVIEADVPADESAAAAPVAAAQAPPESSPQSPAPQV